MGSGHDMERQAEPRMSDDKGKDIEKEIIKEIKKEGDKVEPSKGGLAKIRQRTKAAETGNGKKKKKK
jgi:hypothetical protein